MAGLAPVRGVFLMAGAVPYQKCEGDEIFRRRDPARPRDWVIHSARDLVLRVPFPSGEWLHGEGGGEAIGRHGLPAGRWHRSVETKLGHGDYWKTWLGVLENVPAMLHRPLPLGLPEWPENSRPHPRVSGASARPCGQIGRRWRWRSRAPGRSRASPGVRAGLPGGVRPRTAPLRRVGATWPGLDHAWHPGDVWPPPRRLPR